jgi:CRP/FNR family transcriptional regulator, cyclic AMP receptor protein
MLAKVHLGGAAMSRAAHDPKLDMLAGVPLFAGFDRKQLRRVGQLCTGIDVEPGAVLCREGAAGGEFFIVVEGEAVVRVGVAEVDTIGPGDFFGELALLGGGPRTADVTAKTRMSLLVLSGAEFAAVLREEPQVAVKMLPAIGARIREAATRNGRPLGS